MIAKRIYLIGVILLAAMILFSGCSSAEPTVTEPAEPDGQGEEAQAPEESSEEAVAEETQVEEGEPVVLRVGGMQDVDCWNPFSCTAIYMWGDLLVEGFVDQGDSGGNIQSGDLFVGDIIQVLDQGPQAVAVGGD